MGPPPTAPRPEAIREERLREFHDNFKPQERNLRQALCLVGIVLAAGLPAMELAGYGHLFPKLGLQNWLIFSALVGAFCGAIYYPDMRYWYGGVLPGAFAGPSVLLVTLAYARVRTEMWNVELALVGFVAMVPAVIVYYVIMRLLVTRDLS